MLRFFLLFFLCTGALFASQDSQLIVIYGASCAGKSSLSFALQEALGSPWIVIDRDEVIENEEQKGLLSCNAIEEMADELLSHEIQKALHSGQKVIVDTQFPQPILEQYAPQAPLAVFVYARLPFLLERDNVRSKNRHRAPQRAFWARNFVVTTFASHLSLEAAHNQTPIDYLEPKDLQSDLFRLSLSEEPTALFQKVLSQPHPTPLFAKFPYDLLIKSHQESLQDSKKRCQDTLLSIEDLRRR